MGTFSGEHVTGNIYIYKNVSNYEATYFTVTQYTYENVNISHDYALITAGDINGIWSMSDLFVFTLDYVGHNV